MDNEITIDQAKMVCESIQNIITSLAKVFKELSKIIITDTMPILLVWAEVTRRVLLFKKLTLLCKGRQWQSLAHFIAFHLPSNILWKIPWDWLAEAL